MYEMYSNIWEGIDEQNHQSIEKISQLEDIFKNLENMLMTIDKNISRLLESPLGRIDEDLERDIDIIQNERQTHRSWLVDMIQNLTSLNNEEKTIKEKINQANQKLSIKK